MLSNVLARVAAAHRGMKVLLAVAALFVLGLSVFLSPLVVLLAVLVLIVALFALLIRVLRRRPLRTWGAVAATSLLLVVVFSGITNALYGGGGQEQSATKEEPARNSEPAPVEETTTAPSENSKAAEQAEQDDAEPKPKPKPKPSPKPPKDKPQPEPNSEPNPATKANTDSAPKTEQDERDRFDATATVTKVVDGDTINISPAINGNDEVRLIGMDTPETRDPSEEIEPYGPEATAYAVSKLTGVDIELEFDQERTDQYGRLLAYVYPAGGHMFNVGLVEEGYAQAYPYPPNTTYEDRFAAAQDEAKAAGLGIWGLSHKQQ